LQPLDYQPQTDSRPPRNLKLKTEEFFVQKKSKNLLTLPCASGIFEPHTVTTEQKNTKDMRTKTLLIAAAALAVGTVASMAQTTYSQNVVGYVNLTVPAGKFALVANQLQNGSDAAKTNNNVNAIFSGLTSDPNAVNNTTLYLWNGAGYNVYQYFTTADADTWFYANSGNGFYDSGGTLASGSVNQGGGSFLYNPSSTIVTNTFTGTVVQGTNLMTIKNGFNMLSFVAPVAGAIASTNSFANFPGTSDPNAVNNDVLYQWNGAGYNVYQYFTTADADAWFYANSGNGFYDSGGTIAPANIPVGQAFFINHLTAPVVWTNSLVVQ
jgi:hypothetical protein